MPDGTLLPMTLMTVVLRGRGAEALLGQEQEQAGGG